MSAPSNMSFLEHLETLRWHLIRGFSLVIILGVIAFICNEFIFDQIILAPRQPDFITNRLLCQLSQWLNIPLLCINQQPMLLKNISMSGQFTTHITVSFITGAIMAFPYFIWELWRFVNPALTPTETSKSKGFIFIVSLLFFIGILFGYYIITPMSIDFLANYQVSTQVPNEITLNSYISTITSIVLSAGVIFELPVLIWFLAKLNIVSAAFLRQYRRHAILVIVIVAAIITPPDVISQIMVSLPMIILYEAGIVIARNIEKQRSL